MKRFSESEEGDKISDYGHSHKRKSDKIECEKMTSGINAGIDMEKDVYASTIKQRISQNVCTDLEKVFNVPRILKLAFLMFLNYVE